MWDFSHMPTLVKADEKGRISIRGTEKGRQYLVIAENGGWWVVPAPKVQAPKKKSKWEGSQKDLSEHLQALADLGFSFEASDVSKKKVGPCRF